MKENSDNIDPLIQSPLDVVAKEVKQDDRLCKQVYITLLSTYTKNPINLAINAPTGEGKSYVVRKVAELFPQSDVIFLTAMTDKALFHRQGILVIKDDNGKYQPIEDKVREIDSEIEDKQCEMATAKDSNLKKGLKSQIEILEDKKKDLSKSAMKLIDLNHKALIFVDTPKHTLLEAIMSLLSHDHYEVEYEFVDNFNGIKTKEQVSYEYPLTVKINSESQQIQTDNIKPIENYNNVSKKLFGQAETNNFIILEEQKRSLTFKCFYCEQFCSSDSKRVTHIDNEHPGRLYYPNPEDFENRLDR
jgi:hypothetical protein